MLVEHVFFRLCYEADFFFPALSCIFSGSRSLNLHTGSMLRNRPDGVRWGTLTANAWKLGRGRGATGEQNASLVNFGLLVVQLGIACPPTPYNKMQSWRLRWRWRLVWCVGAWVSMEPWHPFASKKLYISWVIWQVHRCVAVTWLKVLRPFLRHAPMYLYRYTYIKSAWISIDI